MGRPYTVFSEAKSNTSGRGVRPRKRRIAKKEPSNPGMIFTPTCSTNKRERRALNMRHGKEGKYRALNRTRVLFSRKYKKDIM